MTPPGVVFLVTFFCFLLAGAHSVWRFVVRQQLPSLVHAGNAALSTYAAWLIFLGEVAPNPMRFSVSTPAMVVCGWAITSVVGIHLYELRQRQPYDGLFGPRWKR